MHQCLVLAVNAVGDRAGAHADDDRGGETECRQPHRGKPPDVATSAAVTPSATSHLRDCASSPRAISRTNTNAPIPASTGASSEPRRSANARNGHAPTRRYPASPLM